MAISEVLNKQLLNEDAKVRQDAENCFAIMNKLKELDDGRVWASKWRVLTDVRYTKDLVRYSPSKIGEVFLKGIK